MKRATKPASELTSRGQRTRAALLRAAEEVVGARGFDRASIVDIVRAAGVAQGTFYLYFEDKTAVFLELVGDLGHGLRAHLAAAVEGYTNRLEIERVALRAFFEFCRDHRNLYRIIRQAEFVDEATYRTYYQRLAKGYIRGLTAAMDRNEINRVDPEVLAYALMGLADFIGMRWILWDEDVDLDRLVDSAMQLLEHGLRVRD